MDKHLHIISFNIPWPANYGGVIDVFYKLKALQATGVKIILHCFEYERPRAPELEAFCERVIYYPRRTGLTANLSLLPYNVYGRKDDRLIRNLLEDNYPILFEGLHSCYYLADPRLKHRLKIFRECNIEHDYYRQLAVSENRVIRKCFFRIEAWRFRAYERMAAHADRIMAVSETDAAYLRRRFPGKPVEFMPCFHANDTITAQPGQSDFILYHGKLSVVENERAALFLIRSVFSRLDVPCRLAGMDPPASLSAAAAPYPHITIEANPPAARMEELIREAQIHMLVTFQDTGLKLKLLNSLFAGRHTVVNSLMLAGSGLDDLCHIADTPEDMVAACRQLMAQPFTPELLAKRKDYLFPTYSNAYQCERLSRLIFGEAFTRGRDKKEGRTAG